MIGFLQGSIKIISPGYMLLVCGGVGYELQISPKLFEKYGVKTNANSKKIDSPESEVWVHTQHTEEIFRLFGFISQKERDFFRNLLLLSHVGPVLAMNICSNIPINEFIQIIKIKDLKRFMKIPGIGKSNAERLVFEGASKIGKFLPLREGDDPVIISPAERFQDDLKLVFLSLGYDGKEAEQWINEYLKAYNHDAKLLSSLQMEQAVSDILRRFTPQKKL